MVNGSRGRRAAVVVALAALAGAGALESGPAMPAPLPAEAPSSLFSTSLGGAEAELLIKGSWEASLLAGIGIQSPASGGLVLSPGQPLLFQQTPDLFISFLLFKKLFVEARVSPEISQARYSVGWRGGDGDFLRELRVGNDKISFPTLPFLSFGEGSYRSFGAAATVAQEGFEGHAMLRYDQAERVTKRFVGNSEVSDNVIAASAFVKGRWFSTFAPPGGSVTVYVASAAGTYSGGDGLLYRRLEPGEYSYSAVTGFVALSRAAETKVLSTYPNVVNQGVGNTVTVSSALCDILFDPSSKTDPRRQVLARYLSAADPATAEAFVRNPASGLKDDNYEVRIDSGGWVEVTRLGDTDPQSLTYLRPFAADMAWLYTTDFSDTGAKDYAPSLNREVVVRSYSAATSIIVETDVIAGSVELRRNGVLDYAFSVDAEKGTVTLATPPGLAEEIELSYLRESSTRKNGSLAAALGGIWGEAGKSQVWAALGLRWSVPGESFASGGSANPGRVTFTAGERDNEGAFRQRASLAASYTVDEASGRYRIAGMEDSAPYGTSFRPDPSADMVFTAVEVIDFTLAQAFPRIVSELHRDGTEQRALKLMPGNGLAHAMFKTVDRPTYMSFTTLSFFVKSSSLNGLTLTLTIDEGEGFPVFASVPVPLPAGGTGWRKIMVKYVSGGYQVLAQDSESSSPYPLGSTATLGAIESTAARVRIGTSLYTQSPGDAVWIDEILLEESVGSASLNFQGELSWADPAFQIGRGSSPVLSNASIKADLAAALHASSYATGGFSGQADLGPLGMGLHARGGLDSSLYAAFRGGHELRLPAQGFPLRLVDRFDWDPSSGSFGREDRLSASAGVAGLELGQKSSWAASSAFDRGLLSQDWSGKLNLGQVASLSLAGSSRSRPPSFGLGQDYASAWIQGFSFVLPVFEAYASRREAGAALSLGTGPGKEIAGLSLGTVSEPSAAGGALHRDSATMRLAAPLSLFGMDVSPYYKRSWSDRRPGASSGLLADAATALSELSALDILYAGIPFAEFLDGGLPSRFASRSMDGGITLPEALYAPEAGILLSREFGSNWWDLVTPSALSLSFRRELARASSSLTDAAVWSFAAKGAAVNVLGREGTSPSGLPFNSDEYLSALQASLRSVAGETVPRFKFQAQHLATFYAGQADSLSAENAFSLASDPGALAWSESLRLALSWRLTRHWLLDLYRLVVPTREEFASGSTVSGPARLDPEAEAPATDAVSTGDGEKVSLVSRYLEDLGGRTPNLRATLELKADLSGSATDAARPEPTWSLAQSWETKLTVPERLTVKVKGALAERRDGSTGLFSLALELSLGMTVSF